MQHMDATFKLIVDECIFLLNPAHVLELSVEAERAAALEGLQPEAHVVASLSKIDDLCAAIMVCGIY